MFDKKTGLALGAIVLLAACSSPEAKFENGCLAMMERDETASEADAERFCTCLTEGTAGLSDDDLSALGRLMKQSESGEEFQRALERETEDGTISAAGATTFFGTAKSCSVDMVL
jgi:hypothetical protein